jgi:hypothetical protein
MVVFGIFVVGGYVAMAGYILYQAYALDKLRSELARNLPPF